MYSRISGSKERKSIQALGERARESVFGNDTKGEE